jgi:hypothetical protein
MPINKHSSLQRRDRFSRKPSIAAWRFVPAVASYNTLICLQACLHAVSSACGFFPHHIDPFFFFVRMASARGVAFFLWRAARVRRAYMHASGRVRGCSTPRFGPFYTWRWSRRWWRRIPTWPRGRRMGSMSRVFVNVTIARWEVGWRQSRQYLAEKDGGGSIFGWR